MAISPGLEEGEAERDDSKTMWIASSPTPPYTCIVSPYTSGTTQETEPIVTSPGIMPSNPGLEEAETERNDESSPVRVLTVTPSSPFVVNTSVQALGNCSSASTNATPTLGPENVKDVFPTGNAANGDIPKKKKKKKRKKKSPLIEIGEKETEASLMKRQRSDALEYGPSHLPITLGIATQSAPAAITSFSSGPSMSMPIQEPVQYTFGSTASASSPAAIASVSTEPAQPLGPNTSDSSQTRLGATTLPAPAAITSVSTEPAQPDPHLPITLGITTQSAPAAITSSSSGSIFGATSCPSLFRPIQEPVQYTFGSTASAPSTSWSMHAPNFGAFSAFGPGPTSGSTPAAITSVSTELAQPLGPNMFGAGVSGTPTESAFGSMHTPSAITPVSTAPAQSLGSTIFTAFGSERSSAFRSVQVPSAIPSTSTGPVRSHFSTISTSEFGASKPSTFGSVRAPSDISPVSTGPAQSLGQNIFGAGVSSSPTPSAISLVSTRPAQSLSPNIFGAGASGSPTPSAISPVSTGPAQYLGQNLFGAGVSGSPTPSAIGSIQASFGSGTFAAPVSSKFSSKQAPVKVSSGSSASTISSPMRSGSAPAVTSASSAPGQALGGTTSDAFRTRITAFSSRAPQGNLTASASGSLPADASTIHMPLINPSVLQATIGFDPFCTRTTAFSSRAPQGNLTTWASQSFPADVTSPRSVFGHTNAPFSTQLPSPVLASATMFPTAHMPPVNSIVQTPHVSPPSSRCTACGVSSNSSASGCFNSNDITTPPLAATPLPGWFIPASSPSMFGTTPALQAYPFQGFVFLPSTSLNQ